MASREGFPHFRQFPPPREGGKVFSAGTEIAAGS
jgi:hypothetical protein